MLVCGPASARSFINTLAGEQWGKIVTRPPLAAMAGFTNIYAGGNLRTSEQTQHEWMRADQRRVSVRQSAS
ncbi:MAG: hypothetical protein GY788_27500 [bacterium]|nr:hypothetical protein [bacterium]